MYTGIVCRLTDVRPHSNADRLQIANALGYQIIVGLEAKDGDLGVVFGEGGKLSHDMLYNNKLYRKVPVTGEKQGGYFAENGRIKSVKLRQENSEAFFTSLSALDWTGGHSLKEGDEVRELNGHKICEKYYTPATLRAMKRAEKKYKKPRWLPSFLVPLHKKYMVNKVSYDPCPTFKKHTSTTKLRQYVHMIPDNLQVKYLLKLHGTSGRTGYMPYDSRGFFAKLLRRRVPFHYVTGTRNVTKNPIGYGTSTDDGYYVGTDFRQKIHNKIKEAGLNKNEILYYEVVGFQNETTPIMPDHKLKWEDFKGAGFSKEEFQEMHDKYNGTFTYHYGQEPGTAAFYVYRIVQDGKDLSDRALRERCSELGFEPVNLLKVTKSDEDLMEISRELANQEDSDGQLREGVVLRLEDKDENLVKLLKYKSFRFTTVEGIKSNEDNYVDLEETS